MRFFAWLRPGLKLKRWLLTGIIGIIIIGFGLAVLITNRMSARSTFYGGVIILTGALIIGIAVSFLLKTIFIAINELGLHVQVDSKMLGSALIERNSLERGPKIVVIGGGTGLSTMLRGLKVFTSKLTAVVTVSDDGGGSGVLRDDLGILPPGDIRNCILSLARTEPILEKLLQYRFAEGMLKGQNFGNLFLAAMTGICGSFEEAVKKMNDVLAVTGSVIPVTVDDIRLCAVLEDGKTISGETNIVEECKKRNLRIRKIMVKPENAEAVPEAIERIKDADVIVLGPGSLYTSVIPNLLVKGIADAIKESNALKIYVCNIMTQKGETDNYSASNHITAIEEHGGIDCIDYCIVNRGRIKDNLKQKYILDGSQRVNLDEYKILRKGIKVVKADLIGIEKGLIRHDPMKLAATIMKLVNEEINLKEKKKVLQYLHVKDKIKKVITHP